MKINDVIECSELIETFGAMEIMVLNTKYNIINESSMNRVSYEMLNDLKDDLYNLMEGVKAYTREYMDTNRIINESFTMINKHKRMNSDVIVFESLLDDMLIGFINKRKSIKFDGDTVYESFICNLDTIYDNYITETASIESGSDIRMTGLMEGIGAILNNIKSAFSSKHDKIVTRDQKWLKDNKKKLIGLDYTDVELEVPSDYKVSFASLINHHDIFDKNFKSADAGDKIKRFEDKSGNLKNGLDNYFRTGSSRREIGLRKVSGDEAKNVVKSMIDYCSDFLSGKKFIEDKLDAINNEVDDSKDEVVKEHSLSAYLKGDGEELVSDKKGINVFDNSIMEASDDAGKDDPKNDDDDLGLEDDPIDDIDTEDNKDEKTKEDVKDETDDAKDANSVARDRQTGITVLMTIAEERYFDYIEILKSLAE